MLKSVRNGGNDDFGRFVRKVLYLKDHGKPMDPTEPSHVENFLENV